MSQPQQQDIAEAFRQLTDILKQTLAKMTELEEKLTIQIADLTKQVKRLSQSKSESSPKALQEMTQRLSRAITQIDQRVSMFTITEMLTQLERSTAPVAATAAPSRVVVAPRRLSSTGAPAARAAKSKASTSTGSESEEAPAAEETTGEPEVVTGDQVGGDWREKMKRKYGLKEEPGSLLE